MIQTEIAMWFKWEHERFLILKLLITWHLAPNYGSGGGFPKLVLIFKLALIAILRRISYLGHLNASMIHRGYGQFLIGEVSNDRKGILPIVNMEVSGSLLHSQNPFESGIWYWILN